jgi:hypothetical protein
MRVLLIVVKIGRCPLGRVSGERSGKIADRLTCRPIGGHGQGQAGPGGQADPAAMMAAGGSFRLISHKVECISNFK